MKKIREIPLEVASQIEIVLTDIDDTLTAEGKLPSESYTALWKLHEAGIRVFPITGRPAGWCDMIARFWPVDGVVGENGAFAFYMQDGRLKRLYHPDANQEARQKLKEVERIVLEAVPGARVAQDQFSRLFDLAIDFQEEPPFLGLEAARRIQTLCKQAGAQVKISSIHVNAWFGDYDKLSMTRLFLSKVFGFDIDTEKDSVMFCGDSPNDEPMFAFLPHSCAMANIEPYLGLIQHKPAYVTERIGGFGFKEAADRILELRTK